jgi:uncharacterized protein YajQ (UPF0234 family)
VSRNPGKTHKVTGTLKQGISSENAEKITKLIRDDGPKTVKTQIQGDEVRVSSKKTRRPAGRPRRHPSSSSTTAEHRPD